jgi:hypothetical protein
MTVFTRSNNNDLFEMMSNFIPEDWHIRKCDWFNHWTDAESYLHFIIQQGSGYVINCDNDCFIHDISKVTKLAAFMKKEGYTHCGMSDAGVCPHRNNHPHVMNPFFNIFNTDAIRPMLSHIQPVENNIEPYNAFFIHLHNHGKPLYLDAATRSDGITTHLMDHNRNYFALHSWYSREYNTQKDRINKVYEEAQYYRSLQK